MRRVCLIGLLVAACAAPMKVAPVPAVPEPAPDAAELRAELEVSIRASSRALSGAFQEAYLDGLSRDERLVLIAIRPDDVLVGFNPTAWSRQHPFGGRPIELVSKDLRVEVSADGTV